MYKQSFCEMCALEVDEGCGGGEEVGGGVTCPKRFLPW